VEAYPNQTALYCNGQSMSYAMLDAQANQFAHFLRTKGLGKGNTVAILLERSITEFIVLLAIIKTGACYVPLDPGYPSERIKFILNDCAADLLITSPTLESLHASLPCDVLILEHQQAAIAVQPTTRLNPDEINITSNDLCYIIYTSGSTGHPKGVQIEHHSVCNYVHGANSIYQVSPDDRVYQGFSLAFDASVEEIWLAFYNGATLVIATDEDIRSGATLATFLNQEKITVLSAVPTLLSLVEEDIPTLRLLIFGGETLQQDLLDRWLKPQRRIFNTYGPTETTVVATYTECKANMPITIGKPLPNYEIYILDAEQRPVDVGVTGELYIGGMGLARSYVKRPDLTEQRFVFSTLSESQKTLLYRTGDLACLTAEGDVQFLGRADGQIKLRGFRVELPEIETALLECPGVQHAVAAAKELVANLPTLVAYIVPKKGVTINDADIIAILHTRLPDYMIPTFIETIDEIPKLPSGKVDRHRLPTPQGEQHRSNKPHIAPRTEFEQQIAEVWEHFFNTKPISIKDNFFYDLGGHSLFAAKIVSELRKNPTMRQISILDLYHNPTIEQLAGMCAKQATQETASSYKETLQETLQEFQNKFFNKSLLNYWLCGAAQAIGCYLVNTVSSAQFLLLFLSITYFAWHLPIFSLEFFTIVLAIVLLVHPSLFLFVVLAKWLIIGRIKPGNYRLWGWYYFRWWLVQQLLLLLPTESLAGSPLMNLYCRMLGARIGKNCCIATDHIDICDMLEVDDNSSIGAGSVLSGYTVEHGWLKIGPITVGKNCFIGANSTLGIFTTLEDGAVLDDLSMLPPGATIPAGASFHGSPARPGEVQLPVIPTIMAKTKSKMLSWLTEPYFIFLHYLSLIMVLLIYAIALAPGILMIDYVLRKYSLLHAIFITPVAAFIYVVLLCLEIALAKKILLGRAEPGCYPLQSGYYVRKWLVNHLMNLSLEFLATLYGTIYTATWFRLLGAKVGKHTEISTVTHIVPDILTLEDDSFIADNVFIGAPRIYAGYASFAANRIGKRTFVGNSALLPNGTDLGDGCLIGCLSVPPAGDAAKMPGTSWLGSPAVFLPHREIFTGFAEKQTFRPTWDLYLQRIFVDYFRVTLPATFTFSIIASLFATIAILHKHTSLWSLLALFSLADLAISLGAVGIVTLLKWILMGQYQDAVKPAWSLFVWGSELITGLYESIAVKQLLESLLGTPFIALFLRLFGVKIGKYNFINTTDFTEFDLVTIGDNVSLNADATIQTHLFEDRIMKMAHLKIGNNCTVGDMAVILFGTTMEQGSSLASLSLLMKGETLPAGTAWQGIPAQPASLNPALPTTLDIPLTAATKTAVA
ncbi:MAG: Pls/PosA family non-ribosomal peptide synthetase, partial [Gammaproteobacteria bacterium]